ncbi:hypothetical protein EVAR_9408_1 [Eumeta japonica]|uniref:Uncharacterized protein n=1 Tax=Eumeta variegata TaxID=151549 RepID=A0A4C1UDV3_EUMVA|nr:hypothetical protein EVAR_9408_1 [Eumeta japonica]
MNWLQMIYCAGVALPFSPPRSYFTPLRLFPGELHSGKVSGSSPWRPAADMGTNRRDISAYVPHLNFQGPHRESGHRRKCGALRGTTRAI